MIKRLLTGFVLVVFFGLTAKSQDNSTVFDASASVRYLSSSDTRPAIPASDGKVYRWYATKKVSWDATSFKPYIFNGLAFRLKYPKNYDPADATKKYPLVVYFAGAGEKGDVYNNEQQIVYAQSHMQAVDAGTFDGFLLFPISDTGYWGDDYYDKVAPLVDIITGNTNVDANRIVSEGYSAGGIAVVEMLRKYPKYFAAALPMSVINGWRDYSNFAEIPEWIFQGGLDTNPNPYNTGVAVKALNDIGANIKYTIYEDLGHGTWNRAYTETDFYPFMLRANKANPIAYFGRTEFCAGETPSVKLGLTAGFDGYQWRKDGTVISGAVSNMLQVSAFGTYEARIRRGTVWSDWSPIPVVIKTKAATPAPTITVLGKASAVLPAADGATSVTLQVPNTYAEYAWTKQGGTQVLSNTYKLTVSEPGNYVVAVKELYGCESVPGTPFTVVNANGANKPEAAFNLSVSTLSKTELQLNWAQNTTAANQETGFEIYRSTTAGGSYVFAGRVGADTLKFKDSGLLSNTTYYYVVRAVNGTGAAALSKEVSSKTTADMTPPTSPGNLRITGVTRSYIDLAWDASTDDVGLRNYNVYVNDNLAYSSPKDVTTFRVPNLESGKTYTIYLVAKDLSGNSSVASNQVSAVASLKGFTYKYYETATAWTKMLDFNQLTPKATGLADSINIATVMQRTTNVAIMYEGFINIPTSGSYTFETNSDDGSVLYIGSYNPTATPLVNNDGAHGSQYKEGTVTLQAGVYPITVTYFNAGGGYNLDVYWKNTANGVTTRQRIPSRFFNDNLNITSRPNAPTKVAAVAQGYDKVRITWTDESTDEKGFEIYRSETSGGTFTIVGKTAANVVTFTDATVNSGTRYFYKVRAISAGGESDSSGAAQEIALGFNSNYTDSSGFDRTASGNNSPSFATSPIKEGSHSILLNGTNNSVTIGGTNSGYLHTALTERTVSLWFYPKNLTGTRMLLDIGSNTNGIALRTVSSGLQMAIAGNSSRRSYAYATNLSLNTWYHIAIVYKNNTVKWYVNGALAGSDDALPFSSILATTDNSRIGTTITTNAFNVTTVTYASGNVDAFQVYDAAMAAKDVTALFGLQNFTSTALTSAAPALPTVPANFTASNVSTDRVQLKWTASQAGQQYAVYRSIGDTTSYVKIWQDTSAAGTYTDYQLYEATTYFYKLKAVNVSGESAFTSAITATTTVTAPTAPPQYIYVNFHSNVGNTVPAPGSPWNNFNSQSTAGSVLENLKDADGNTTAIKFTLVNSWTGHNNNGLSTGNNSGIYPDNVLRTFYFNSNDTQMQIKVTGLDPNRKYDFSFFGSWSNLTAGETTEYSIGSTTVSLQAVGNTSNTADIKNIVPNASGELTLGIKRASGTTFAFLNAIKITSQANDGSVSAPDNLVAVTQSKSSIKLTWNDNSTGETGFEVSRSTTETGTFSVVATAPANATTYTDNGLTANTKYWYKVRAMGADNKNSAYTSAASASTILSSTILVNFHSNYQNAVTAPGAPWNTFNAQITSGSRLSNLKDTNSNTTGVGLTLLNSWSGHFNNGPTTGNNSGVYPDNVLQTFYFNSNDTKMQVRVTGLDTAKRYNFTFLGAWSNQSAGEVTNYSIGDVNVSLQAVNNISNTAQIKGVAPNAAGEITFGVQRATGSTFAFLNALAIEAISNDGTPEAPDNLIAVAQTKTSIKLSWNDNSTGETGFEVSRSATETGTYSTITTTAANATSYNDNGLTANTKYWYKVRALGADNKNSAYTAAVSGSTILSSTILVNFHSNFQNAVTAPGAPWNTFNSQIASGSRLSNLKDTNSNTTGVGLTLLTSWSGHFNNGPTTGNNSGIYPDNVLQTFYFNSNDTKMQVRVTGLDTAKRYNFTFMGAWSAQSWSEVTNYTIGDASVTLQAINNTANTAQIKGVVPNAAGEITFGVQRAAGSTFAFLNALAIESEVNDGTLTSPDSLRAITKSKTGVQLNWNDNSTGETGFEVSRASASDGPFAVVATTAANATTYTDNGLAAGTRYWYRVRALGTVNSDYSATATASTYNYSVQINFGRDEPVGAPWNNTTKNPEDGDRYANLVNTDNVNTGITMILTDNFSGANNLGVVTGSNSGKYPDLVNKWFYYSEKNETASIRFTGLNTAFSYDFEFFNSFANPWAVAMTTFTINGKTVSLDPSNNVNNTVLLNNINPDQYGEITVDVFMTADAAYGMLSAMVLHAHPYVGTRPVLIARSKNSMLSLDNSRPASGSLIVKAYPNPFTSRITVSLPEAFRAAKNVRVDLTDQGGRILNSGKVNKGETSYTLDVQRLNLMPGAYFLRVSAEGQKTQSFKMIRE
ncbi:MAG: fibronectin type III domain-containing protein [Mucilaginibacter polytrichastri]|nr:fibronectin type III domain-containing protein [Mucilaginibacter polytrichastri]